MATTSKDALNAPSKTPAGKQIDSCSNNRNPKKLSETSNINTQLQTLMQSQLKNRLKSIFSEFDINHNLSNDINHKNNSIATMPIIFFETVSAYAIENPENSKARAAVISSMFPRTFPRLSTSIRDNQLKKIHKAITVRNQKYLGNRSFALWSPNKPLDEIIEEYNAINLWRQAEVWYENPEDSALESREDFVVSQALLTSGCYRKPHCISFEYNNTDPSYNSSTVILNGLRFLALEAPSKDSVKAFRNLIHNQGVKTLVCLTPEFEGTVEKCFPYWKGELISGGRKLRIPLETERTRELDLPYNVNFVFLDSWKDNESGNAGQLLDLIMQVRNEYDESALLACHCHAGVGRTGTFIVGFTLLHEIDQQIAAGTKPDDLKVSVEEMVMKASLQRFHMVGQVTQYCTLYQTVDLYVSQLKQKLSVTKFKNG
jgi:hypothetical protein